MPCREGKKNKEFQQKKERRERGWTPKGSYDNTGFKEGLGEDGGGGGVLRRALRKVLRRVLWRVLRRDLRRCFVVSFKGKEGSQRRF